MPEILKYLKRSTLITLPVCGILWGIFPRLRLEYYTVVSMCAVSAYSLLINFPSLSHIMHRKPIYYEDLEDTDAESHSEKVGYQRIFVRVINVPLSIFIAMLAGYFIYRVKDSTLSPFEIVGVIGGITSIYGNGQKRVGQFIIDILNWRKQKFQKQRKLSHSESLENISNPRNANILENKV